MNDIFSGNLFFLTTEKNIDLDVIFGKTKIAEQLINKIKKNFRTFCIKNCFSSFPMNSPAKKYLNTNKSRKKNTENSNIFCNGINYYVSIVRNFCGTCSITIFESILK